MDNNEIRSKLFNRLQIFRWNVEFLDACDGGESDASGQTVSIEIGDFFKFMTNEKSEKITDARLTKPKQELSLDLPFFLCLSPIWFVDRDALYLTFIAGDKICDLRKVAFRFEGLDTDKPKFFFSIDDSADCQCGDCCDDQQVATYALMKSSPRSVHGAMGGGSGEIDL